MDAILRRQQPDRKCACPWSRDTELRCSRDEEDGGLANQEVGAAGGCAEGFGAGSGEEVLFACPSSMQLNQATALLTLCLWALCQPALGTEGKRKLQIGVKKRVENCPIKSRKGDVLHMHYTGKLEDGTEFDSSIPRDQPFIFSLGTGQVIKGWDQGLLGMCEGEKRKLVIPSELGYGDRGAPPKIPGGATLIFEVELLKIERRPEL
ncbi:peptidyl-prolyl cis-trans isomerase FKBP2 isoform X2 [Dermochelys coriacea]|uniref:peptidyl-prolyl cis-trans isomerase FKBP2 isoform X2 n=1 Tax=Dermochelys coriacea TaxID=27794 RepID=UPI0018E870B7|nr:peptidyl-prolyl cis-trans isomerase FKBP2 isoform X2 [Dermochelys coriacea]